MEFYPFHPLPSHFADTISAITQRHQSELQSSMPSESVAYHPYLGIDCHIYLHFSITRAQHRHLLPPKMNSFETKHNNAKQQTLENPISIRT